MGIIKRWLGIKSPSEEIDKALRPTFEKLEHQRNNPHLYTTLTQYVDVLGNVITYDQVTAKIQEAYTAIKQMHAKKYHQEECGVFCHYGAQDICAAKRVYEADLKKAQAGFVRHYHDMQERIRRVQTHKEQK